MKAVRLQTEHMKNPVGINLAKPFLSWICEGGVTQTAYEIRAFSANHEIWNSGKVQTNVMHTNFSMPLKSRQIVGWQVRLWDENNEADVWSEIAEFEMGLLNTGDWKAKWINPEGQTKESEQEHKPKRPASYLRKNFSLPENFSGQKTENARLYVTSHGIYQVYINGKKVSDFVLAPGPGTYHKRLCYQTYDVVHLLQAGDNEILVSLGDGWYRSCSGVDGTHDLYGKDIALFCQLEVGGKTVCCSDESWQASQCGPVRDNDMQQGETYDARMEEIQNWHDVKVEEFSLENLACSNSVPILENESFTGKLKKTPNGETVIDFGQNLAGYVEFTLYAHAGERIVLYHGESLDENGNFTNANFQPGERHKEGTIQQKIVYICKEGINCYKPSFTIMGFQYVKIETDISLENAVFTAHAVYSQMEQLSNFSCSNVDMNQLFHNSIWSQKSNFCDIPTDCPTRERAGWTGDAGVFVNTGLYLMNCYPVFRKWLGECRLIQHENGKVYNIAPPNNKGGFMTEMLSESVGWGDACIIVPYHLYLRTGNIQILEENYEMMKKWYSFLEERAKTKREPNLRLENPYALYTVESGMDYGEWCEPGVNMRAVMANPKKSIGTAYLAQSGKMMSEIARTLGKEEEAVYYQEIADKAKKAYRYVFTNNGKIESDRQCEYVRALKFNLLSKEESEHAARDLNQLVIQNDYHLNTGFLSTPFLCEVLVSYGYVETAYRLLLQDTQPSWLYAVKKGANTIWETWDGIGEDGKVKESLNHYSYGVISGWLIEGVCGIHVENGSLTIKPCPFPALNHAKVVYASPIGKIESGWRYEENQIVYQFEIPSNVTGKIVLPNAEIFTVSAGRHTIHTNV